MLESDRKYSCVIIDDEFSSVFMLSEYISLIPKLKLIKSYVDPASAIKELTNNAKIDFLFLDIHMQISGIDVAKILRERAEIIVFITGYPEHALAAFGAEADDFMVKPIDFRKFLNRINRLIIRSSLKPGETR